MTTPPEIRLGLRTGEQLTPLAVPQEILDEPLCHNPRVYQGDLGTRIIVSDDDNTVTGVCEHHVSVSNQLREVTAAELDAVIGLFFGNDPVELVPGEKPGVWHLWPPRGVRKKHG